MLMDILSAFFYNPDKYDDTQNQLSGPPRRCLSPPVCFKREKNKSKIQEKLTQKLQNFPYINAVELPVKYKCPISGKIMHKPVIAENGVTYDKQSILNFFTTNQSNKYLLANKFPTQKLTPNDGLTAEILNFLNDQEQKIFNLGEGEEKQKIWQPGMVKPRSHSLP